MAIYAYRCSRDHVCEQEYAMGHAPASVPCCDQRAVRVYGDFQFSEDRTRFFRNQVDGTRYSYSLGMRYPDSRAERNKVLAALRCEPVTLGTMPQQWKDDREAYLEHKANGAPLPKPKPVPRTVTVLDQLRRSNAKFL